MAVLADFDQKPVQIVYSDPFAVFDEIDHDLTSRFPLNNLHWTTASRQLRHIPVLPVQLVKESGEESIQQHQMLGLTDSPYLKVMFVKCDSDSYKSSVRKMIRDWVKGVMNLRDPTEWLIIYYTPGGDKPSGKTFQRGIYDKLRADFNSGQKRDRCVIISKDGNDLEIWSDVLAKIKDGILSGFSERVKVYEQEIDKFNEKRDVAGWNFGTFFVLKESLALSFENMGLFSDALQIYDDLESDIATSDKGYFSLVGFDDSNPRSYMHLNQSHDIKEHRHKIAASNISLFDFHNYLMHRQSILLLREANASSSESISALKVSELYARLRSFILDMANKLESNDCSLNAVVEWSFDMISEYLEATNFLHGPEVSQGRGDMILLCRKDLETLAGSKNWTISPLIDISLTKKTSSPAILHDPSNPVIKRALESKEAFYEAYTTLTKAAIDQFKIAGRDRVLIQLDLDLACVDYQTGNYKSVISKISSLPATLNNEGWAFMSSSVMKMYIDSLQHVDTNHLDLLSNKLELVQLQRYLSDTDKSNLSDEITALMKELSTSTDKLTKSAVNFLSYKISPYVLQQDNGYYSLTVAVHNKIGVAIDIERAHAVFVNDNGTKLEFVSDEFVAEKISTDIAFKTKSFIEGSFTLASMTFHSGCLTLEADTTDVSTGPIIYMSEQPFGVWSTCELGNCNAVNQRDIKTTIHLPSDTSIESINATITASSIRILQPRTVRGPASQNSLQTEAKDGDFSVNTVQIKFSKSEELFESILVEIPLEIEFEVSEIFLTLDVGFQSNDTAYTYHSEQNLDVRLAVDVNMESFFKSDRIISKFSAASNNESEPLRISQVQLIQNDQYNTEAILAQPDMIATSDNPLSYIFLVKQIGSLEKADPLALKLFYRFVSDECRAVLFELLTASMKENDLERHSIVVKKLLRRLTFDNSLYLKTRTMVAYDECLESINDDSALNLIPPQEKAKLLDMLKSNLNVKAKAIPFPDMDLCLTLNVSVPNADIVHIISIQVPQQQYYELGEPIKGCLNIESMGASHSMADYSYSLSVPPDTWAIAGKKQATFTASNKKVSIPLALVPLRKGRLLYPKISIAPVTAQNDLQMKVDYLNDFDTVLVISAMDRQTTFFNN